MSTWEERMSAKAHQRIDADLAARAEAEAEKRRLDEIAERFAARAELLAGPPDGCTSCYAWLNARWPWSTGWHHGESAQPGPDPDPDGPYRDPDPSHWCWHSCHKHAPVYTGPIAYAVAGIPAPGRKAS